MFEKLVIVGPGLVGGSLGMAVRAGRLAQKVVGVCRRPESAAECVRAGAADEGTLDLDGAAADADLIVLATGVETISQQVATVLPRMKRGAILTDVGGAKEKICRAAESAFAARNPGGARFVGGHPLAGSERRGIAAARPDLFRGALCVLTPTPRTDPGGAGLAAVTKLWQAAGSRVLELSPETHDRLIAQSSHLPHLAAACVVNAVSDEALQLAAQGFLDTTRVASGDPRLWVQICLANREAILPALAKAEGEFRRLARALEAADAEALTELLERAKSRRDAKADGK